MKNGNLKKESNSNLAARRKRMITLVALGNSLGSVAASLSREFGCSEEAIYHDYETMHIWGRKYLLDAKALPLILAKLDFLTRKLADIILEEGRKGSALKIGAINSLLKVISQQVELTKAQGVFPDKTSSMPVYEPVSLPFEGSPLVMNVYRRMALEQAEEKKRREEAQRNGSEVSKEDESKKVEEGVSCGGQGQN